VGSAGLAGSSGRPDDHTASQPSAFQTPEPPRDLPNAQIRPQPFQVEIAVVIARAADSRDPEAEIDRLGEVLPSLSCAEVAKAHYQPKAKETEECRYENGDPCGAFACSGSLISFVIRPA